MTNAAPWLEQYPFESHYLQLGAARLHYVDEGTGRPLLMVHGNPTWSFYWRRLVQHFRTRYRVIAVDHIGCGWSDKPQDYPYTLQTHIDNLATLVESLQLADTTLVAHDWGGAIGLGTVVAQPPRFRSLVLLNTGAFPPPYIPWRIRACRIPGLGTWCVRRLNLFARAALWMAVARRQNMSPAARAGLLAPYDSWEHRVAIDRFVRDIPASPRHPTWRTLAQLEQQLAAFSHWPVQLIWGMQDWCFRPACLARLRTMFPQAESYELHEASHYVLEDAPRRVIECMEPFLERGPCGQDHPRPHSKTEEPLA
jgi:haloalkane dehalogenase